MHTVLLINDTEDWYHFGCTATSLALKKGIVTAGYELTSIPITETYKIKNTPSTIGDFKNPEIFQAFKESNKDIISEIEKRDILIINGEGTIHGMRAAPLNLLYIAYASKVFLGKHVEILNHSVYPQDSLQLDDPNIIGIYKLVYGSIDFAAIREHHSFQLMQSIGLPVQQSFDCMPLYIRHYLKTRAPIEKNTKKILIAGSAAWLNLNIPSAEKGDIQKFEKELSGFISYLNDMNAKGYMLEFLYGAKDHPAKDDVEFIEFIGARLNFKLAIRTVNALVEWLGAIEEAHILISGRFHHTIAAACLGTPVIVLNSNTPKIEGMHEILFHSSDIFQYTDSNLRSSLGARTEAIMRGENAMPKVSLHDICAIARNNFNRLLELRTPSPEEQKAIDDFFLGETIVVFTACITLSDNYFSEKDVLSWKQHQKDFIKDTLGGWKQEVDTLFNWSSNKELNIEQYYFDLKASQTKYLRESSLPILHLDTDISFIRSIFVLLNNGAGMFLEQWRQIKEIVVALIQKEASKTDISETDMSVAKLLILTDIFDSNVHVIPLGNPGSNDDQHPGPDDFADDTQNHTANPTNFLMGNYTPPEEKNI